MNAYSPEGEAEDPNLNCAGSNGDVIVTSENIPRGDCCQGAKKNELASDTQFEGGTSLATHSGHDNNACDQTEIINSSKLPVEHCLDGASQGITVNGAAAEGSRGDDDGNKTREIKKKRTVRATRRGCIRWKEGMKYIITINSKLGEACRKLATKAEKCEFIVKYNKASRVEKLVS